MRHCWWCLLPLLATGLPAAEQPPADAERLAVARLAHDDVTCLKVFVDLGVGAAQAGTLAGPLRRLGNRLRDLDRRVAAAEREAARELLARRQTLLTGQPVPREQPPALARLEQALRDLADEREAAYDTTYNELVELLTPQQQAALAPATTTGPPAGAAEAAAAEAARRQAEQRQAIYQRYVELFDNARRTRDPRVFQQHAPGEALKAAVAATGLNDNDPLVTQLARVILEQLAVIYQLEPQAYRQQGPTVANQLAGATLQQIAAARLRDGEEGQPQLQQVDPERLRQAVRYERAAELLEELREQRRRVG